MRQLLCMWMLVVASGCAYNRQYFRPTERVHGQTVQGYHEAFYDLTGPQGPFGEAKVWTIGAYRRGDDSVIEVSLELHNTSAQPIIAAAQDLELDPVRISRSLQRHLKPQETGTFTVSPESRATIALHFVLPPGVYPGHVTSFGFVWRVRNGEQGYAQQTPFREESAYYPPTQPGYLYYNDVYPCSPYDIHCVGTYWPYETYRPASGPPRSTGHRPVEVGK